VVNVREAGPLDLEPGVVNEEWKRMAARPVRLERPLLCVGGWRAHWHLPHGTRARFLELTGAADDCIGALAFPDAHTIDEAARRIVRRVDALWGEAEGDETREIDVVAVSMGGLASRLAATEAFAREHGRRLKIHRLFTLATPHRGACLAKFVRLDKAARQMKPGSEFLARLDERLPERDYELVCYGRTRDLWVGLDRTHPEGHGLLWAHTPPLTFAHLLVSRDRRLLLDIARRLRGEEPISRLESAHDT